MTTQDGIRRAKELGLDLVVVSPNAVPPVAKVIDYGEYTYIEKKKKNEAKKKQHRIEIKEVKFRPNTDQHDYEFKKNHALRFLQEGNKVKATIFFRGREITHANLGERLLKTLAKDVEEFGNPESTPRMEGRSMSIIIGPKKEQGKQTKPKPKPEAQAVDPTAVAEAAPVAVAEVAPVDVAEGSPAAAVEGAPQADAPAT